jgi:hypothetical protein
VKAWFRRRLARMLCRLGQHYIAIEWSPDDGRHLETVCKRCGKRKKVP